MLDITKLDFNNNSFGENLEILKNELSVLDGYEVTVDNYSDSKKLKQSIGKAVELVETNRKNFKNECLKPYEEILPDFKLLKSTLDTSIDEINKGILDIDTQEKIEKKNKIEEYFNNNCEDRNITFDRIFNQKWLNKSVNTKHIEAEIDEMFKKMYEDLSVIANDNVALNHYYKTFNLSQSIQKSRDINEIINNQIPNEVKSKPIVLPSRKNLVEVKFKDENDKVILFNFLKEMGYEFKEVK